MMLEYVFMYKEKNCNKIINISEWKKQKEEKFPYNITTGIFDDITIWVEEGSTIFDDFPFDA